MPTQNAVASTASTPHRLPAAWPKYREVQIEEIAPELSHSVPQGSFLATFIPEDPTDPPIQLLVRPPLADPLSADKTSKRPPNMFVVFCQSNRRTIMSTLNGLPMYNEDSGDKGSAKGRALLDASSKFLSVLWKAIPEEQKAPFRREAARRREKFNEAVKQGPVVKKPAKPRSKKVHSKEAALPPVPKAESTRVEVLDEVTAPDIGEEAATPFLPTAMLAIPVPKPLDSEKNPQLCAQPRQHARLRYEGAAPALKPRARDRVNYPVGHSPRPQVETLSNGAHDTSISSLNIRGSAAMPRLGVFRPQGSFAIINGDARSAPMDNPGVPSHLVSDQYLGHLGTVRQYEGNMTRPTYQLSKAYESYYSPAFPLREVFMNGSTVIRAADVAPSVPIRPLANPTLCSGADGNSANWSRFEAQSVGGSDSSPSWCPA